MTTRTQTDYGHDAHDDRAPMQRWHSRIAALAPVPDDVLTDEITDIVLFRLSLLLNRATGGAAGMTFSARTALACTAGGWTAPLWHAPRCVIDLFCATTRGEVDHCATALANHRRRT